jgi:formylglycine-generating enzyme required for sulfatase activity
MVGNMTAPITKKLFISYRSSDAAKVDKIAADLTLLHYDDGTPRFTTWQDKHNLPPASPNWWDAIVDAIERCDMFVLNLSRASLQSEVCRAELDYAHKRNRPIIPLVLEGEFFLDPQSGKYNLPKETWALVPEWLGNQQFLFYISTQFYHQFESAVAVYERNWPRDIYEKRPLNPDSKSVHSTNHALYAAACDYAYRLAFADAEKHFDTMVRRNDPIYADASAHWLERIRLYTELIDMVEQHSPMFAFKQRWAVYQALPADYLDGSTFDPKGLAVRTQPGTATTAPPPSAAPSVAPAPKIPSRPRVVSLLPNPFSWIQIPAGKVTLVPDDSDKKSSYLKQNTTYDVPTFSIAKYPLTNGQYAKFVEAGGYRERRWWTEAGWGVREKESWMEPRFWTDATWNQAEYPVVGVSWFEAIAFCRWLSESTGEAVTLPTEQQWQRSAQGNDNRDYPWGKPWDANRCNNNVDSKGVGHTTPVQQYEASGASPFGVVDLSGNVWEWCLTDYESGLSNISDNSNRRVLRGGSWYVSNSAAFRCGYRNGGTPDNRDGNRGFRLALS